MNSFDVTIEDISICTIFALDREIRYLQEQRKTELDALRDKHKIPDRYSDSRALVILEYLECDK